MDSHATATPGAFCWLDLAASDSAAAKAFYARAFGWSFEEQHANGGRFTRCRLGARDVGSLYPLGRAQLERGVPSHWTPYLRVADVDALAGRIAPLGGRVLVSPFEVERTARIALIEDAVGAVLGLWQSLEPGRMGTIEP
jgi:predicted enzyme related to lactoylglutathione lyase